jgi:hypothetical protein
VNRINTIQFNELINKAIQTPVLKTPTLNIPQINPVIPVFFPPMPSFSPSSGYGSDSTFTSMAEDYAYLPDFTSRILGLEPEKVSVKNAQKKIKQLQTGFEIRRGAKIKW